MILAGDIGGTKTTVALMDASGGTLRERRSQTFASAEFASLDAILDVFLRERDPEGLVGACFGVAGPVDTATRTAKITNLPWTIDARALTTRLRGAPTTLINDLQATALGTLVLPDDKLVVLQEGARDPQGVVAVIAPGTGLGEAFLVADGRGHYRALASEGGHADFAPGTDDEIKLLRALRSKHGPHVSNERVLSGAGIGDLYDFCRGQRGDHEEPWLAQKFAAGDRNAAISEAALARTDGACVDALEMFAQLLGAEAGNLALRVMATGGVVIGGGIPPKILPALQSGGLVRRFNDKGRFAAWTQNICVRVALEPRAALLGAAHLVATTSHTPQHTPQKDPRA